MKRLAYYPGCSLHGTARELDRSFRATMKPLGVQLAEIPGWECCGNTAAHSINGTFALALPVNEMVKMADMGADTVAVPCAACFNRFMVSLQEMDDAQVRKDVGRVVGRPLTKKVAVRNLVDVYHDEVGLDALAKQVVKPLRGLKLVAYYGCLLTRPPKATLAEDPEYPTHMEAVLRTLGATTLDWSYKTACCGASLALCEVEVVVELVRRILVDAAAVGADGIVAACPLCQANLDQRQEAARAKDPALRPLPIFYLSQLVGEAIGLPRSDLGFKLHMVDPAPVLA